MLQTLAIYLQVKLFPYTFIETKLRQMYMKHISYI